MKHIPFILMISLSLFIQKLSGQCSGDNTFTGAVNNDWYTAGNWSAGCVPTSPVTGLITIESNCTITYGNYSFIAGSKLQINNGITLTNLSSGGFTFQSELTGEGTYTGNMIMDGGLIIPGDMDTPPGWVCGDPLVYGGQSYATVQIGGQCWMAENLNIGMMVTGTTDMTNNGTIEKYCYNNDPAQCTTYGGLYQWDEMMQYTTVEGTQGVCPTGWHLPSDAEWTTMTDYVGNQSGNQCNSNSIYIAKSLASMTLWITNSNTCAVGNNQATNNTTGFTALPAGTRFTFGSFSSQSGYANFWSSSESGTDAWDRQLYFNNPRVPHFADNKSFGFSVRCIKD